MSKPKLICVVGPTAVGKTTLAIELAKSFKTEIISADSRQFYKELELGTAKPSEEELALVPHHFINSLSIHDYYDVGQYEKEVLSTLNNLFERYGAVILVGGSGLFVDAVCNGLDEFPEIDGTIRGTLNSELEESGLGKLQDELKDRDIDYYNLVDLNNPQRVIRALEVIRSTGETFSKFRKQSKKERPFSITKIGLEMDRAKLYERIDVRMDRMISNGLFEEATRLLNVRNLNALQTVGYKEIFSHLNGEYDKEEAIRLLKRNSRRYAKRQLTWFKKDLDTIWFNPEDTNSVKAYLTKKLELSETKN